MLQLAPSVVIAQGDLLAQQNKETPPTVQPKATPQINEALRQEIEKKREALRDEIAKMREQFRKEASARRAELQKKVGEKKAELIENFFGRMVLKFEAAINRLISFADRTAAALLRAAGRGYDVAALQKQLIEARLKIGDAAKSLEEAKTKYTEAIQEKDLKISFKKVREAIQETKQKIKDAHRALVKVVGTSRGLGQPK